MATKWTSKVQFPKDSNYIITVKDATFGPSKSSGKPMITMKSEISAPDTVMVDGEEYTVAGVELTTYYVTQSIDEHGNLDAEKTKSIAQRLEKLYKAYGMDFATFNPENPDVDAFKGKRVYALLEPEVREQRKQPTAEQIKNKQMGDVLKNPVTGKALVNYFPKVGEIFGVAE